MLLSRSTLPALLAILAMAGCGSVWTRSTDRLDPVPAFYTEEVRDSIRGVYTWWFGNHSPRGFTGRSIDGIHLLAWNSFSNATTSDGYSSTYLIDSANAAFQMMILVHMTHESTKEEMWSLIRIWGRPGNWMYAGSSHVSTSAEFDHPPTSAEIYETDIWYSFFDDARDWPLYDGYQRVNTWEAVTGEKPTRPFVAKRPAPPPRRYR